MWDCCHRPNIQPRGTASTRKTTYSRSVRYWRSNSWASRYHPEFAGIRVADDGGFAHLSREQMVAFWHRPAIHTLPTRETTIDFTETNGDTGYALLTRTKDLGNGWEPLFYCLVWKRLADNTWRLWREYVHRRSAPDWT